MSQPPTAQVKEISNKLTLKTAKSHSWPKALLMVVS